MANRREFPRKAAMCAVAFALVSAAIAGGLYFEHAQAQTPPTTIEEALKQQLSPAEGMQIQIAPMTAKGSPEPGTWTTIPNDIWNGILGRTGITPGVSDPVRLKGRPGVLDVVTSSDVLNKGGTRATIGYFIRYTRDTGQFNLTAEYFMLLSYDQIKLPGDQQFLTAFEVFLFGPVKAEGTSIPFQQDPPILNFGLAVNANGQLLAEVPLELANVKNLLGGESRPVKPGVSAEGTGCLECHGGDQFPDTTLPFPWSAKPDVNAPAAPNLVPGGQGPGPGGGAGAGPGTGNGSGAKGTGSGGAGPQTPGAAPGNDGPGIRITPEGEPQIETPEGGETGRGNRDTPADTVPNFPAGPRGGGLSPR